MNKSTAIALAVAVAAGIYTGAAWQMGRHMEQGTAQALEQAQQALGAKGKVSSQYERGLFGASNAIVIELPPPVGLAEPIRIHLAQQTSHNPLAGASARLQIEKVQGLPDELMQAFAQAPSPVLTLKRPLLSDSLTGELLSPAGQIRLPLPDADAPLQVQWADSRSEFTLKNLSGQGQARLTGQADNGAVQIQMPLEPSACDEPPCEPLRLELGEGRVSFEQEVQDGLWLIGPGQLKAKFKNVRWSQGGKTWLQLGETRLQTEASRQGDVFNITQSLQAGDGQVMDLKLQELKNETRIEKLSAAAMRQLQEAITLIWQTLLQNRQGSEEEIRQAVQELAPRLDKQLQTALTEALQAGPAVHERYAATLGGKSGFVEYGLALQAPEAQKAARRLPPALMALMLMQTMQVNAKASVPHAWAPVMAEALNRAEMGEDVSADEITEALDELVRQGMIQSENEAWTATFEMSEGGKMKLNGRPLN